MKQKFVAFFKQRHNKTFYLTSVSQLLIVIQTVLSVLGYDIIITEVVKHNILTIADAVLSILALYGVVIDPTNPKQNQGGN
jgi:phi LC3 family holin